MPSIEIDLSALKDNLIDSLEAHATAFGRLAKALQAKAISLEDALALIAEIAGKAKRANESALSAISMVRAQSPLVNKAAEDIAQLTLDAETLLG